MSVVRVDGTEAVVLKIFPVHDPRAEIVFDDQHERIKRGRPRDLGLHPDTRCRKM